MYQLLEDDAWLIADTCGKLIECIPTLVRDDRRMEDIRKVDGDDPADAARYGLVSGARFAGLSNHNSVIPRSDATRNLSSAGQTTPHFAHGMPLSEQIARQVSAEDPTSRAIHYQRLESEARQFLRPKRLPRRWNW
jgi:hypothetical protein